MPYSKLDLYINIYIGIGGGPGTWNICIYIYICIIVRINPKVMKFFQAIFFLCHGLFDRWAWRLMDELVLFQRGK